ncbi:glycosyl hydrolase 115 family protein [Massilia horti]|uniref:Gylcosyl hydrolase 115 C-terminal domain-containing protein n=1 Tax=Massilia horti TaxID=2562153 RepID=A0A4Y9T9H8_9BURK|nr:glycosyl hydrolase 115 family protein [Massilia horti]TFW34903.1 hypothetical protein E4O92_02790 [Massilia horti]
MLRFLLFILALALSRAAGAADPWITQTGKARDFALVSRTAAAPLMYDQADAAVVAHAVRDLAADVERVTGRRPEVKNSLQQAPATPVVLVGTLGGSVADALASSGKIDPTALHGAWESFIIATVEAPMPGVPRALAIIGSDPRGTAFGVYELSQAIGVSPWYWWADVAPARKDALYVAAGTRRLGPPSVKYRGIFLNDEDWGMQPWAAKTFEPEHGGIGPKTYTRLFELLLRLKANTLWPAMHPGTPPFNSNPANAALAGEYAIVMGSSHAEPMLRNNVGEWKEPAAAYNYLTNRDGVLKYWDERLATNGSYENFYTLGMRGIHDSHMQGPKTDPERVGLLQKIFADQRALLESRVNPQVEQVPQLFCAYKEVLGLYRQGLEVPDDVTIMWPDDNFGYVRNFANAQERKRAGGFGVYYHLSYLGAPMSYLWLSTTPPALVWEEMNRAYDAGAQRIWIANVGDLKPAEINTEFFLQMAWDIKRWRADNLPQFLTEWAGREFGAAHASEIADIMAGYYRLNYRRRPEHLQWWLPKEQPRASGWTVDEAAERLAQFTRLRERVEALAPRIGEDKRDAWFELVAYPVTAAALANQRFIEGERGNLAAARAADARLDKLTDYWNTDLAGGKWRHMMAQEPADRQWPSFRLAKWTPPGYASEPPAPATMRSTVLAADRFDARRAGASARWQLVPGLGHTGAGAMTLFPATAAPVHPGRIALDAPRLSYRVRLDAGEARAEVHLIPTYPNAGSVLRLAVALDDGPVRLVELEVKDGGKEWAQGVLDNVRTVSAALGTVAAGQHTLHLYGVESGVVVDKLVLTQPLPAGR